MENMPEGEPQAAPVENNNAEKDLPRIRGNIARIIESGRLSPEVNELLATINLTSQIEGTSAGTILEEPKISAKNGMVDFGVGVKMSVFVEKENDWQPKFYPTKDGRFFNLGFVASDGSEFIDPEHCQRTEEDDPENPAVEDAIRQERKKLDGFLQEQKSHRPVPPERKGEFVETEYAVDKMREIVKNCNRQFKSGRGALIIEGEAGTGKNWMIDHIAYLTNRPVFRFTCDPSKETPELKYLLEFVTDEKGSRTVRISSTVVEALQTEGAILELDEINTLRPDVSKSLNSLLDSDRAFYFGEDNLSIKAAREVLIIGLMNPSTYAGVKPLPETIKSRSRIMLVDYPPFEGKDKNGDQVISSSEAEMLYRHFKELGGLKQAEFVVLWDKVVNGKETKAAEHLLTAEREQRIRELHFLLKIANDIRRAYIQYHEEGSGEEVNYNFGIRESLQCVEDLSDEEPITSQSEQEARIKEIVNENYVSKLDTKEERKRLSALINEI